MPRLERYFLPEQPLHVTQRGNNRQAIFFDDDDYACYRDWLAEAAAKYGCVVHAYVLMTNHVHLLSTPQEADSLPRVMQSLGAPRQHALAAHGNAVGGTLSRGADRQREILSQLLPVYRAQPGPCAHGAPSARVSLVQLPRARAGLG